MFYAQLDEDNVCIGISDLSGLIEQDNMIALDSNNIFLMGQKYINGRWEALHEAEAKTLLPNPSELALIQMAAIADLYENQENDKLTLYAALADICEMMIRG